MVEAQNKKQRLMEKFNKLINSPQGLTEEGIRKTFHDEPEALEKFLSVFKEKQEAPVKVKEVKPIVVKKQSTQVELEIQRKLDIYEEKLNNELLFLLNKDKNMERERKLLLENTFDAVEAQRLRKINEMEKAKMKEEINRFNEEMDDKLDEYRRKLETELMPNV